MIVILQLILMLNPGNKTWSKQSETTLKATIEYKNCYYCHSLKPDNHLTGPSLHEIWGKKIGKVPSFPEYSDALKNSDKVWNKVTMSAWLKKPADFIPGNNMVHNGISDNKIRKELVRLLEIFLSPGGAEKALKMELLSKNDIQGQLPKGISNPQDKDIVTKISHCGRTITVTTADQKKKKFWEMNLNFKTNSGLMAPEKGKPILVATGSMGDRFHIIFQSKEELINSLQKCDD